ncbi:unnamed protein product [Blepharisma stoltei]|uniref:TmcB/TmcC TPR repeats domain-containing protein n=1 Tax=Blepharisma stoltei TaxID=1481888 RepID=A0AAU9IZI4_9CILI|nr:unnamed protein product [Blepharisma stoltei]
MSNDFDNEQKESTNFNEFTSQAIFSNPIKEYLYGFFGHIFETKYNTHIRLRIQIFYELIINIIFILQLSTLSWHPSLETSGWNSYVGFWKSFSFISYDEVCESFELTEFCFYGTVSLIGTYLIFFIVFGIFMYLEKEVPRIFVFFSRKIASLLTSVCVIPSTMILSVVIKYSLMKKEIIEEYSRTASSEIYNFGVLGILIGIFCLLVLIFINWFCEAFSCDMRHSNFKKNIKARSCSKLDLKKRWFNIMICILYVYIGNWNAWIYQIIFFFFCFYLCLRSIQLLQYFNIIENCIHACKMASVSCTLVILLFGELVDNALIIVLLHLFVLPFAICLTYKIIQRKYEKMPDIEKPILTQFDFEQKYRSILTNSKYENKNQVIEIFKALWQLPGFHKDKLFVIWEFNYCYFIMKDERLARIKLTKIADTKSSFEGDIQEWRLFNWLFREHKSSFNDIDHLKYLKDFSKIKKNDEELCLILTELQAEFSSKNPRLDKLSHLVDRTAENIYFLSDGYNSLIEKYKNSEVFEYYATFLDAIVNNHEEADFIIRKKSTINFFSQQNYERNLENYGKDLPTILASCSSENFGTIVYINDKASQLLMSSMGNIIGLSILNFIPQPYSLRHEKLMKDFIFNCNSTEILSHDTLFFLQNTGYLLECNFMIKLTAFHNCAYFLISFRECSIQRQLALISEEGIILSYTEGFLKYFGWEGKNIKGNILSDIIPISDLFKMKEAEPFTFKLNDREIAMTYITKTIKTKNIHMIVIIDNINEFQKGKEDRPQVLAGPIEPVYSDEDENEWAAKEHQEIAFNSTDYLAPTKTYENPDTTIFTYTHDSQQADHIFEVKNLMEKKSDSESRSRGGSGNTHHKAKKLLMDSKRKIRVLQLVLFLVMFSVIITDVAILIYMGSDVSYTSTLGSFQNFGRLVYDFELSADLALTITAVYIYGGSKEQLDSELSKLKDLIDDLEQIKGSLFKDFEQWSYCPHSKVVREPSILLWYFEQKTPQNKKENLYDTVANYIYNAKNFISAINADEGYWHHGKFLYVNGLGGIFHDADRIMDGLVDCEIERVKSTGVNINILLISGFCTLGVLVLIIIGYIMLVAKKVDEFWNFTLNSVQWAMLQLKCCAMDRLATTHGLECKLETSPESQRNTSHTRKVKGTLYLQYIWRIMLFFAVAASYYLLIFNYFYPILDQMMTTRPSLLNNFIIRRALLMRLSLFSRDRVVDFIYHFVPEFYDYAQSLPEEATIIEYIDTLTVKLRSRKYSKLLSKDLKQKIYEQNKLSYKFMDYGSDSAMQAMIGDIEDVGFFKTGTIQFYLDFVDKIIVLANEIKNEFVLADRDSYNIIDGQLENIVNTTIIYCLALCIFIKYDQ